MMSIVKAVTKTSNFAALFKKMAGRVVGDLTISKCTRK